MCAKNFGLDAYDGIWNVTSVYVMQMYSFLLTLEVYGRVKTVCDLTWYTTSPMMGGLSYQ